MWQDPWIAVIDIVLFSSVLPMVWRIFKYKQVTSQSLITSVSIATMMGILGCLYWTVGLPLAALAHLPAMGVWTAVAYGTIVYRRVRPSVTICKGMLIVDPGIDIFYKDEMVEIPEDGGMIVLKESK